MGLDDILKAGKAGIEAAAESIVGVRDGEEIVVKGNGRVIPDYAEEWWEKPEGELLREFAEAWWAEKDAKQRKEKIKKRILKIYEHNGIGDFDGEEGVIKIIEKAATHGLIAKKAKEFLTEDQIKECTGITKAAHVTVTFTPAKKRPKE